MVPPMVEPGSGDSGRNRWISRYAWRMRAILLMTVVIGTTACTGGGLIRDTPEPTPTVASPPEEVEVPTEDGLTLRGTWSEALDASRSPGVLLLHQFGPNDDPGCSSERHDRADFDGLAERLVEVGISVLALDLRDHGASDSSTIASTCSLLSDRDHLPLDVQAGIDWLQDRPLIVSREAIGVAGISVGANLTLTAANRSDSSGAGPEWGGRAFVSVSARQDRASDFDPQGDVSLVVENTLFIVAEGEEPQATQNQEMYDENLFNTNSNELLFRPGSDHGIDLLRNDPVVGDRLVSWFEDLWM